MGWGQNALFQTPASPTSLRGPPWGPWGRPWEQPPPQPQLASWTPYGPPLSQRTARIGLPPPPGPPAPSPVTGPSQYTWTYSNKLCPEQRKVTEAASAGFRKADVRGPAAGKCRRPFWPACTACPADPPTHLGGPAPPLCANWDMGRQPPSPGQRSGVRQQPDRSVSRLLTPAWTWLPSLFLHTPRPQEGILERERPREVGKHRRRDRDSEKERDLAEQRNSSGEGCAGPAGVGYSLGRARAEPGPWGESGRLPQGLRDPQELGQEAWPGWGRADPDGGGGERGGGRGGGEEGWREEVGGCLAVTGGPSRWRAGAEEETAVPGPQEG